MQSKFGSVNNFLSSILRAGRSALGKVLAKIYIVIAMVVLKFIVGKQRRNSAILKVIEIMEEGATSGITQCRNPDDNDASRKY